MVEMPLLRVRKKHIKKPTQRISEGVGEGVREGGFGARILCVGVIFSKLQRIKNFKGGGSQGPGGGGSKVNLGVNFFAFVRFFGT